MEKMKYLKLFALCQTRKLEEHLCGAFRELIIQLGKDSKNIEILVDDKTYETRKLSELLPDWWGNAY